MVLPTNNTPFPIGCFNEYSTVMIRRNNKVNFTRSWREYREGFGNLSETHWLGLEQIHLLTSQNRSYRLVVQVSMLTDILLVWVFFTVILLKSLTYNKISQDVMKLVKTIYKYDECLQSQRKISVRKKMQSTKQIGVKQSRASLM